ncbi:16S rRNA (guanine(966)-N(2))-methyltransferase RsmD [Desmospora profundinema]|uniref:16S rRNA (Guanine(966)-N(2))-methyltransferase RsmD n=1 Tax=Desmospora profundinema TaxID=1571184 RepID=A0ABU1IRS5_9BACL|nr:16S rRNA (guanine(966)-N(2))-methyltransferase RsmD [Desmospora profundinema]MDR6227257.1 16S rRNA (guanine(966)-N(2))-methyltransferase RsmD [Desmospora profundinema]
MRIIAGKGKGKRLKTVSGFHVRPTTDRVKESVFQVIGPYLEGGWVLDLFAGSGSLGLEALSRGADHAVFVDQSGASLRVVRENLRITGFEGQAEVYRRDARAALRALTKREARFRYIFLDPPYREPILTEVLQQIAQDGLLEPLGTVVAERASDTPLNPCYGKLTRVRSLEFGDIAVDLYQMGDPVDGGEGE